jgi:tyrocidine synthetase-3
MNSLDKKNVEDILALTPMQEGMLYHYLKEPESDQYFEQLSLKISGEIDIKCFEKAWNFVVNANEILRTLFRWEQVKNPTQVVLKEHKIHPKYYDVSSLTIKNNTRKREQLEAIKLRDRKGKFDLHQVPFRIALCKTEDQNYELIISYHHILFDGWSTGIILKEFVSVYRDLVNKRLPVKPLKTKFKEFIRRNSDRDRKDKDERFWKKALEGLDADTFREFSLKKRISEDQPRKRPGNYQHKVDKDIKEKIEAYVKQSKITLAALLYSAWGILLQKYNSSDEAIFGITVSGRKAKIKGIENMVGLFINTLPVRIQTHGLETIEHFLNRMNHRLQIMEDYENSSLVDIKKYSGITGPGELFDTVVVIENYPLDNVLKQLSGPLSFDSYSIFEMTHYHLTVDVLLTHDMAFNFCYRKDLFDESLIMQLAYHYTGIIKSVVTNPGQTISDLEIVSAEEKRQLLVDFNRTDTAYPQYKAIHQLFAEQVKKTPGNIALVGVEASTGEVRQPYFGSLQLTYKELNEKSNQLAHILREKGINPDTIVGIMVDPSIEMVIAIFGILEAGGAYLPIDPGYPEDRINYMLADSGTTFLLSMESTVSIVSEVIELSSLPFNPPLERGVPKGRGVSEPAADSSNLAYVIYTSGSTGKPKGVVVEHQSAVNILAALQKKYPLKKSDTYLLKTPYIFDVSVTELFGWFLGSGRLAVQEKDGEKNPSGIIDTIERIGITHINFVPSQFNIFLDRLSPGNIKKISGLKYIFLAGEVLLRGLVKKFKGLNSPVQLENLYGPTEAAVYASGYSLSQWPIPLTIPIGKPLQNVKLYILDKDNHLQPVGVPGELAISGAGVARGYLNRPSLTSEKFREQATGAGDRCKCENKTNKKLLRMLHGSQGGGFLEKSPPGRRRQKIYKTGDLGRWVDGNIEFLGRIDHQVKIRGFRIELGEIESQLLSHKEIKEAVVSLKDDESGDKFLCAYIVPRSANLFEVTRLKTYLREKLPDYMVPAHFVTLTEIPLTATGKIDRKSLPGAKITSTKKYIAPRSEKEKLLVRIWSEVLGIEKENIGINDNFFELGGHSLKAARLITRIHKAFDIEIPLSGILKALTIRELCHNIERREKHIYQSIPFEEKKEYFPLSPGQKRFYVFQQMEPGNTSYNIPEVMLLEGSLLREIFEEIFRELIKRHESLRTSFLLVQGEPMQKIHKEVDFEIEYYIAEGKAHSAEGKGEYHAQYLMRCENTIRDFVRPFDLTCPPLIRLGFIGVEAGKYFLVFDIHHIISDGVSINTLTREFLALYEGEELPPLRIQYRDYVGWITRRKQPTSGSRTNVRDETGSEEEVLNLPTDYPRPGIPSYEGITLRFEIDKQEKDALISLSLKENTTFYMTLLSAFNVFLSKLSGQENIVVGSPIAGRLHHDLEGVIGLFINTMVLQNYPSGEKRFSQLLAQVKTNALQAFDSQEYQYEELVEKISSARETGRNPFFDVMFVFQNMGAPEIGIPGLTVTQGLWNKQTSKFDMTLYCQEKDSHVFRLEYCTALFKLETIRRFIRYFKKVITGIVQDPDKKISRIEIISEEEKQQVLYNFNDTPVSFPGDKTVYRMFEEQVERDRHRIAVVGVHQLHQRENICLTYSELNRKSNQLAASLIERGVLADSIVGIMVKRSIEMIIGIFGILKAGAAYLPIDPHYPGDRIQYMLKDSEAKVLVTTPGLAEKFAGLSIVNCQLLAVNEKPPERRRLNNPPKEASPHPHLSPAPATSLAYVIYTSGSTGKPKGVMIEHMSVINRLHWMQRGYPIKAGDVILQKTTFTFDVSVWELFWWSFYGAGLCLLAPGEEKDPGAIVETTARHRVTTMHFVPSMLSAFLDYLESSANVNIDLNKLSGLRQVFASGEALGVPHVKRFNQLLNRENGTKLINLYGPTEATVDVSYFDCPAGDNFERVPIGRPIDNIHLYVVDRGFHLQPPGIVGELCISGVGLARGYLNRSELTAEKFCLRRPGGSFCKNRPLDRETSAKHFLLEVPGKNHMQSCNHASMQLSPHHSPHSPIYRSGDLARWLTEGNIEFLGRIDHQIKVRGFRIELGEIEGRLLGHEAVKDVVVTAIDRNTSDRYLCAYIVANRELTVSELQEYLSGTLPDYMIPAYFVHLEHIPLNPNGKVDRKALPKPDVTAGSEYVPPRNEKEHLLVGIWSDLLGIDSSRIGIDDNFFRKGGHSLNTASLVSRIHQTFSVEIPMTEIFKFPTIREICKYIDRTEESPYSPVEPVEEKEYYPLSSAQRRLYVLQQLDENSTGYNIPTVVVLEGELDNNRLERTFKKLVRRHESLRTSFHMILEETVQRIHPEVEFEIDYQQIPNQKLQITNIIKNFIRVFELSRAPLLRVGLIKKTGKEHILVADMHHIITDGISIDLLVKEFTVLYAGKELLPLRLQYKYYAEWQNSEKEKEKLKRQEEYWLKQFEGEIPVLNLPLDYTRPVVQSFEGNTLRFQLGVEQTKALKDFALKHGVTLYMLLLAIYNILLSKLGSQEDIVIGTPIAARRHVDLEQIIGMFVNTLTLRNYPGGSTTINDFLKQVKERTLAAFENQEYPFEDLVEKLTLGREVSRNPMFDCMFALQNIEAQSKGMPRAEIPGLIVKSYKNKHNIAKFDINFACAEVGANLSCAFEYCTKLFKKQTIRRFIFYFKNILHALLKNNDEKLSAIEMISAAEKRQILDEFNNTEAEYPRNKTIYELFAEQVEKTPDNIAVIEPGDFRHISYNQLNQKASGLARLLKNRGVTADTVVGLQMERTVEMVTAVMGILIAGAAYLPLVPGLPAHRREYMVRDASAFIVLSHSDCAIEPRPGEKSVGVDKKSAAGNPSKPETPSHSTHTAYVIYTSGSTGKPKGVMIEHSQLLNFIYHMYNGYKRNFGSNDNCLGLTEISFDVSVCELFLPLSFGASIFLAAGETKFDVEELSKAIVRWDITFAYIPPGLLSELSVRLRGCVSKLRLNKLLVGVEPIRDNVLENYLELNPRMCILNGYGPTETTICSTTLEYRSHQPRGQIVPIGTPIANTKIVILDNRRNLVPGGIPGEICVSGAGVGRGYLNNPGLTAEKFVPNPSIQGKRMYKTGDLGRWLENGSIEFTGRIDGQVKIRGYRIETGEIENQLLNIGFIKEAKVIVKQDRENRKYLCGYIVSEKKKNIAGLKKTLSLKLPRYMIPSYIMQIEKIPLTSHGKIDWKAFPEPGFTVGTDQYTAPRDEVEKKLVSIWAEVLGIEKEKISIDSNFFELGGHSLNAALMTAKIHRELKVKLSLVDVFTKPVIRILSVYIKDALEEIFVPIPAVERKEYYKLSSAQKRLYVLQQLDEQGIGYNIPSILILEGDIDRDRFRDTFHLLINRHESLRTSFHMVNNETVQRIHDNVEFKIEYFDLSTGERSQTTNDRGQTTPLSSGFIRPFDLSRAPLFRVGLIKLSEEAAPSHILMMDIHHITADGISCAVLIKDFVSYYTGKTLPGLKLHYKDYAERQNSKLERDRLERQKQYWLKQFAGELPVLNLPTDYPRSTNLAFDGDTEYFEIPGAETKILKKKADDNGATLFMILLTLYYVFLSKISGQEDIIVGTMASGRNHADLEQIIGMFVNTLALRNYPVVEKEFPEFLKEIKARTLQAFENQDYQFEELVEEIGNREKGHNPLFDAVFEFQNITFPHLEIPGLKIREYRLRNTTSKFDLKLTGAEVEGKLLFSFEYRKKLFERETIEKFIYYFKKIVTDVTGVNGNKKIADFEIGIEEEKEEIMSRMLANLENE